MRYEEPVYRPFSESNSYLLQCTIGCSHNKCTFCGMYKNKKYRVRTFNEIREDIEIANKQLSNVEKVFLCDGDAIAIETEKLLKILDLLYKTFPKLRHVGTYVGPVSTLRKSDSDLKKLKNAGLTKTYLGVESGDDEVLNSIKKGVNASQMLEAGQKLVNADMNLSAMVMLGIAQTGKKAVQHALKTAEITNLIKPNYLAAMTYTPVPGTILFDRYNSGNFILPDPFETIEEMKLIFENITIDNLKFVGAHASNYLSVSGTLQKDRTKMLKTVNEILSTKDIDSIKNERSRGI